MRIGEIAVVAPHPDDKKQFIQSCADSVNAVNEQITFGEYVISDELVLHLYGIVFPEAGESDLSWDLISSKILGYIVLFRWGDADSFRKIQRVTDYFTTQFETTVVVAAHTEKKRPVLPKEFAEGIPIDRNGSFTFCDVSDPASTKKVLLTLVNQIIDTIE